MSNESPRDQQAAFPSHRHPLSEENRHVRMQLQQSLLRREANVRPGEVDFNDNEDSHGIDDGDDSDESGNSEDSDGVDPVIRGMSDLIVSLPHWSYLGCVAALMVNAVLQPYAPNEGEEAGWSNTVLKAGPFLALFAGMLQRIIEDSAAMYQAYGKEEAKAHAALLNAQSVFITDLEHRLAMVGTSATVQRDIARNFRACKKWLKKIRNTPEAVIRPEDLARRLDQVRQAVFPAHDGLHVRTRDAGDVQRQHKELLDTFLDIVTAYDADCNDAALEALEDMETAACIRELLRLQPGRFLKEARSLFREDLLKEVANVIGKSGKRNSKEELEVYFELKSLLSEELGLRTRNKYMQFRTVAALTGEEIERALAYTLQRDKDEDFVAFLSGRFRQTYEDFLRHQFPVFGQWREKRDEWYADKLFEAGKQEPDEKRIEEASSLISRKDEEGKQVIQDYAWCLMSGSRSRLADLECRLMKSLYAVESL